ncbi:MAG TPA: hypothetical protein PKK10_04445 [Woeseiaceae bacterium]|nr:hypothetical protein [Woeseiaceae bacterium]
MKADYFLIALATLAISACGQTGENAAQSEQPVELASSTPAVSFTPANDDATVAGKPSAPITISYKIIGKPLVGQPLAVELRIKSVFGDIPVRIDYRINDTGALRLADSQPAFANIEASIDAPSGEQVTVVPLREGRSYLNVSASVATDDGSVATVTAIPIAVGDTPRKPEESGTVETDAGGNAVRVLKGKESN